MGVDGGVILASAISNRSVISEISAGPGQNQVPSRHVISLLELGGGRLCWTGNYGDLTCLCLLVLVLKVCVTMPSCAPISKFYSDLILTKDTFWFHESVGKDECLPHDLSLFAKQHMIEREKQLLQPVL